MAASVILTIYRPWMVSDGDGISQVPVVQAEE